MGKTIFKVTILLLVLMAAIWAVGKFTGGASVSVNVGKKCRKGYGHRRNPEAWQPAGVIGPMAQPASMWPVPLAAVNP
jgi:hypothetical protein